MAGLLLYCRSGFESDVANEVQEKASQLDVSSVIHKPKPTVVLFCFTCYQAEHAELLANTLVCSIQSDFCPPAVCLSTRDRKHGRGMIALAPLLAACEGFPLCGELRVEYADTTDGRELSKFCRKISVPLRQALRKKNRLTTKDSHKKPVLHVFFTKTNDKAYIGYSFTHNNSPLALGILRLKFPHDAPSRSTLKLDEAFQTFIPKDEHDVRLRGGTTGR